ncbi:MAG: tetratricopeptide repeat protein [Deltaproteobacteria bacterium]|nr:tetratricopeptide repeat protein [Deltaproteobacteria bacterium]MBW2343181.1 tetratricopeptide repeat protein [Deltaproteobacteria bacterium]
MKMIKAFFSLLLVILCLLVPGRSPAVEDTFQQGLRFLTTQRYDLAIKAFSEAIEVNPRNAVAYCNRGVARFFTGDHEQAIADFTRAVEINPGYTEAYCNRGGLWAKKGDRKKAVADYTRALEIHPRYPVAYCGRGIAWANSGDYDRAIADFTTALKINPRYADAYCNRGASRFFKKDYDRAIADCTKALHIDPGYSVAYLNRGRAWFSKKDCVRAITDFEKALDINPNYAEAGNQLAWTLAVCPDDRYRNGAKAVELAKKVTELMPEAGFRATLAAAYAEAGKFEDATKTQESVIALLNEQGKKGQLSEYKKRLEFYRDHKPWREEYAVHENIIEKHAAKGTGDKIAEGKPKQLLTRKAVSKKLGTYSYTIQVASCKDHEMSNRMVTDLRKKGDYAFNSRVHIPGKGDWTRIFIGFYENRKRAQKAVLELKKGEFRHAYVVKKPYAIQVGSSGSDRELQELEADLRSKGYLAYSIRDSRDNKKDRLLVGAFSTKMEAEGLINKLQQEGFATDVVLR